MEFLPGDRIPELQIAALLSISRTPIHDALRRLEAERLVTINQNRGASVTFFSDTEITEVASIRIMQDVLSAQLAAYYGSASDFDRLDLLADQCEAAAKSGDDYIRLESDIALHLEIARISRNSRLLDQQKVIYQQIRLILIQLSKNSEHSVERTIMDLKEHKPLINSIRSGDIKTAVSLLCQHTKDYYRIDPYFLKCYNEDTSAIPLFFPLGDM